MRGRRPDLKAVEGGLAASAPVPSHIPKAVVPEWNRVTADLKARNLLVSAHLGTVASYCIAVWQLGECVKAIQADGAFVKTKTGEPKPHPALGVMNKSNEIIARLAAELGITPASRSRRGLGGETSDAADPDAPEGLDV